MKESNEIKLGDAIRKMLESKGLDRAVSESMIREHWEEWMGKTISRYTTEIKLKEGKLLVHIQSGTLKNELLFLKKNIQDKINEKLGQDLIHEIVFL